MGYTDAFQARYRFTVAHGNSNSGGSRGKDGNRARRILHAVPPPAQVARTDAPQSGAGTTGRRAHPSDRSDHSGHSVRDARSPQIHSQRRRSADGARENRRTQRHTAQSAQSASQSASASHRRASRMAVEEERKRARARRSGAVGNGQRRYDVSRNSTANGRGSRGAGSVSAGTHVKFRGSSRSTSSGGHASRLRSHTPSVEHTAAHVAEQQRRSRLIRAAVLWAVVIVAAVSVVFAGVHFVRSSIDDIEASTAEPDPKDAFREIPCTPEVIEAAVKYSATYAGKPVDFTVSLTNKGVKRACYLNAGYADMRMKVMSGSELIWDSNVCRASQETDQLLINAGASGNFALQWPGKISGSQCAQSTLAQPGTYHAQLFWKDQPLGSQLTFELKAEPPKPASTDGAKTGKSAPATSSSTDQKSDSADKKPASSD